MANSAEVNKISNVPLWQCRILIVYHFGSVAYWQCSTLIVQHVGSVARWQCCMLVVLHVGSLDYGTLVNSSVAHWKSQKCKQLFMYLYNWDKGVAPAICPCLFSAVSRSRSPRPLLISGFQPLAGAALSKWGSKYAGTSL